MKPQITFTILLIIAFVSANSQSISISKKDSEDPSNVCNNSTYSYVTTITNPPSGYTVSWIKSNGEIQSENTSEASVKWISDTDENDGWIGTIKAQLKN